MRSTVNAAHPPPSCSQHQQSTAGPVGAITDRHGGAKEGEKGAQRQRSLGGRAVKRASLER